MKVRHKVLGVELEVLRENITILHLNGNFYQTVGGSFISHRDPAWEKVEEWEDITAECEAGIVTTGGEICIHHNGVRTEANHLRSCRYRKIDGLHHGPAFIVERRKS